LESRAIVLLLRAICSIASFGIAKFRAIVEFPDANKIHQIEPLELIFFISTSRTAREFVQIWNRANGLSYCFY